ncbi:MAG: hypothetical protein ACJA2U_001090 [Marinomonas primoryensis]|jgi:hypothetical protein|tara:strand:- start:900 stop:1034 length:135 start_codon:yes stop_codon:yes gene_type:complete
MKWLSVMKWQGVMKYIAVFQCENKNNIAGGVCPSATITTLTAQQ